MKGFSLTEAEYEEFLSRLEGVHITPPIPVESIVKERIHEILNAEKEAIDIAIDLCMYSMKTQVFIDGNKRASVIYANHYLS